MKVLLFLETDISLDTGDGINERESVSALLEHYGDRIVVVLPQPEHPERFHDSRIRYVPNHRVYRPLCYLRFLLASWRVIRRIIRKEQIDAVVHRPGVTLFVPYLITQTKTPLILKTLAAFNHMNKNKGTLRKRLTVTAQNWLAPKLFSRCAGGDVVSSVYVDWFHETYGMDTARLCPIFNGANARLFQPLDRKAARQLLGVDQFEFVVGYIGAIHPMRGLDVAVESLVHRKGADWALVLVGEGPEESRLRRQAASLGVADRVVFRSPLPYCEMPRVINAFDVGLDLTKVHVPFRAEERIASFSQKISQYLACGVPVIAWDTPDTRFVAEHDLGGLIDSPQASAVAAAIRPLVLDRRPARARQIRGYFERHLSADVVAHRRFALWQSVVDEVKAAQGLSRPKETQRSRERAA